MISPRISFSAMLYRPALTGTSDTGEGSWTFLKLPKNASDRLASRGMVSVTGTINGRAFRATLDPDGKGGHWMKVEKRLSDAAGVGAGDRVSLEIAPVPPEEEPEPTVPGDLREALSAAASKARDVWEGITPVARRDWIQWIVSAKKAETRARRVLNACDMLAKGKRRPCCFDRSGMFGKNLSCPRAEGE